MLSLASSQRGQMAPVRWETGMTMRANASTSLRYGLEELKFLRSFEDLRILGAKLAYKLPTLGGELPSRRSPIVPPSVQIEPTNLCNLRCITCPGARTRFPKGYMDMGLFQKIVSEASEIGVKRIHLYLRGEAMLHPKIFEMISFIKSKGLAVHLVTNGTTLTPERSAVLLNTGVNSADQLTISFIGHSKASHEATMVGVDHDLVVRNIIELVRLRKELGVNGPVIETIFNAPPETQHEAEDFLRFWRGKVDHARLGEISIEFREYKTEGVNAVTRDRPCNGIYERLLVAWNGQVPQCNGDFDGEWILGDLNRDSITEIWNCERLQAVRRIHQDRQFEKLPMCLHCDM
jgi:radical SAM protein with 4Fe4S-binding SPASM domain